MPLRVRHGSSELILSGEAALARLYRQRRLEPSDLVWHAGRQSWVRVDAFLFMEEGNARRRSGGTLGLRRAEDPPPAAPLT